MKDQVKIRDLCWISCFCCFSVLFMKSAAFHTKSTDYHENQQNQVNMCVYMHHLHIHAPTNTTKIQDIPSWPSLCTLWKTRPKWEIVLNQLFFLFAFQYFSWKAPVFIQKSTDYHENQQNQVNMCAYMHHLHIHAPHAPQNMIYLVGLPSVLLWNTRPKWDLCWISCFCCFSGSFHEKCHFSCEKGLSSVLYERAGQNERSVLNQLFLLLFRCFSWKVLLFIWKAPLFMKTNKTRSICVYTCTIYTYMHHQIPPDIRYTYLAFPLYSMKNQVKMRDLCWIRCFCCFSCEKRTLFIMKSDEL